MELPREPTIVPQARRYTDKFTAMQGKVFREGDKISIDIPRLDKTYLSKNVKLHFDFDMTYEEASDTVLSEIYADILSAGTDQRDELLMANNFFGKDGVDALGTLSPNPTFAYTKPMPTFDINGPYGLIHRLQVFSYLNNTLLEDIQEHDLLTGQFSDFWFSVENMDIQRPYVSDNDVIRKHPCASLYPSDSDFMNQPLSVKSVNVLTEKVVGIPVTVRVHCQLDLISFLGRLSDKFVPLHNGFRLVLTLNKFNKAVKFNTLWGNNQVFYKKAAKGYYLDVTPNDFYPTDQNVVLYLASIQNPSHPDKVKFEDIGGGYLINDIVDVLNVHLPSYYTASRISDESFRIWSPSKFSLLYYDSTVVGEWNLTPTSQPVAQTNRVGSKTFDSKILTASVSNVYLKADLLEISSELDGKVDKMVYSKSFKYQQDFFPYTEFSRGQLYAEIDRAPFRKRILPDLRSVTKVFVGQRQLDYYPGHQEFGYRIKNYTRGGRLLFNSAEVTKIDTDEEAWVSLQRAMNRNWDIYLTMEDFTVQEKEIGTEGNQMVVPLKITKDTALDNSASLINPYYTWFPNNKETFISTLHQGRYLLAFDTRIPGATDNAIAGIDTSKSILEYEIIPEEINLCVRSTIDVFVEHDLFVNVDPGKSTSVTF